MDPRDRADAVLARAQARAGVVTPDNQTSPMDASNTQQIPRRVVDRIDTGPDPDTTTKLPSSFIEANDVAARDEASGQRDSHLAAAQPTTPLPRPTAESAHRAAEFVSTAESAPQADAVSPGQSAPPTGAAAEAGATHPRTEPLPTGPVDKPNSGQLPSEDVARDDHDTAGPPAGPGRTQQGRSPGGGDADDTDGMVPTVRTEEGQSYLSRRLDGL